MDNSEQNIIKACQQGNLQDFGVLYDQYIKKIYNFIYFRTQHKETAEDLTSQTFLKALEKINRYSDKLGAFSSWLYQIARNTVIDYWRTLKKTKNIDDVWGLSDNYDVPKDLDTKIQLEKISESLRLLNVEQREIIIMRVWDGLAYREIAEITRKSEAALKMIFSRTINKLREQNALGLIILLLTINY